ncbi:hypothetical protein TMatcc_009537 [Talaromyces marneffei ATCC 18224]|uniref:Uncharacterized protein n=2 Tax=Talaromyces marneffei TaxID=37727 RepID=B6QST0_TALMQ|nr:hypothetical protein PMAA_001990 [Talaromyces marneffei ATCC 18224]KAE8547725.1 hypothetical protein EYB25_009518 [Talaromyces marneffei]
MGISIPTDAAPAYEDLFRPGNASSGYASIPQNDNDGENNNGIDIEQHPDHVHLHQHHPEERVGEGEGHTHCTACDGMLERKERRRTQRHCCTMVAATFMVAFVCALIMLLSIFERFNGHY